MDRKARIQWLKPEDGGRPSPPLGPNYSTVARFEVLSDRWPHEAWSIVLSISAAANSHGLMLAGIRMLAGDDAPKDSALSWQPIRSVRGQEVRCARRSTLSR